MLQLIKGVFLFFVPPRMGSSAERRFDWEFRMSIGLSTVILVAIGLVAYLPVMNKVFASEAEFNTWTNIVMEIRQDQLDSELYATRGRQCGALQNKNRTALESETRRLQEELFKYEKAFPRNPPWRVPPCEEY